MTAPCACGRYPDQCSAPNCNASDPRKQPGERGQRASAEEIAGLCERSEQFDEDTLAGLLGHRCALDLRDARTAIARLTAENEALRAGLNYVAGCFEAARIEGIADRLADPYEEAVRIAEDNRDRSIWGLVERRLMGVEIFVRRALAPPAAEDTP